jgi:hypothetical protein
MVAKRSTKTSTKRLKLKKETLKNLDAKGKASKVKGGAGGTLMGCLPPMTRACRLDPYK